ncbi:threonine/serine exporter family protein [Bacillus sp. FJAT-47783]|uniref:threonine/serine exporter family protein n=1 Tax=Bacillus sp. FJAT-47783 TaxID=2922712 RepID=UPI001FAD38CE|nr:threonine/serine exporter family protein [Bacillus sp. FJAT-47783]
MEVCLLAGAIMSKNGAETYRVEDTMKRIAHSFGVTKCESFVMPTGIIFSINDVEKTKLIRIPERTTDLHKVVLVNGISRKISNGELTVQEAYNQLKRVEIEKNEFSTFLQIVAASVASGCFLIMFQGEWSDFIPAMIAGGFGFITLLYMQQLVKIKFFAEFIASFIIGITAYILVMWGVGTNLDLIIIGSVMPLVPGLLITNAVRDLMAGHLVSGLSKGAEAFLTAFAIGAGIAAVLSF